MRYELKIALKYILSRSKVQFISVITLISVIGIATGVATLIIVIGVMSGFDYELQERIIGTSSHIVVDKIGGLDETASAIDNIKKVDEVVACAPFINTQALVIVGDEMASVVVRGIDQELEPQVTDVGKFIKQGDLNLKPGNKIIVGSILEKKLFLRTGDKIRLVSAGKLRNKKLTRVRENNFEVSGIFSSDMYDYDSGVVFVSLENAKVFTDNPIMISGISVKIKDVYKAKMIKKEIQERLGFPYYTRTWMDINRNLFDALKLEKTAMFVILTLIILVAALNIISTLIMMVMEKTKDIGILKSIGATAVSIRVMFTFVGLCVGIIGTIIGSLGGLLLAYLLKTYKFIKLPEDVYYINTLPVKIEAMEVLLIIIAALGITFFATFYPAYKASKLNPVEALRYE